MISLRHRAGLLVWIAIAGLALLLVGTGLWTLGPPSDRQVFCLMRLDRGDVLAPAALFLSRIGGFAWLGPLAFTILLWLLWRNRPVDALWLLATVGGGRLVVEGLKLGLARPRPPRADWLTSVTSLSFPSSHAAGSMLTGLAIALILTARIPSRYSLAAAISFAFAFAAAVGWSRIALGVHWPSDVIAGLGLGLLWVGISGHLYFGKVPAAR